MSETVKINCNIIKDLLPSYLDDLCTADTKHAVEEHLSSCSTCRNLAGMMQTTDFVSKRAESAEIDYMIKIKRHFIRKGSCGSIVLAVFVFIGFFASVSPSNTHRENLYYFLLPIMLAATNALLPFPLRARRMERPQKACAAVGILLTCYGIFIHLYLLVRIHTWVTQGYGPFHLNLSQMGPFLSGQFLAVICYQTAMYLIGIYRTMRGKAVSFLTMSIYLTCGFITLNQYLSLRDLTGFVSGYQLVLSALKPVSIFILEGILVTLLFKARGRS